MKTATTTTNVQTAGNSSAPAAVLDISATASPGVSSRPSEVRSGILFMSLSVVFFTANTLLLNYLGTVGGVGFSLAMLVRAVVGVFIVFFFFKGRRPLEVYAALSHPRLILRGILGVIGTAAFYYTIPELGAGKATLIGNTYVLFAAVFAAIFLHEILPREKIAWLVLAFAGIAFLTGADVANGSVIGWGEVVALIGALTAGWVVGLIRQLTLRYSNATIYLSQCFWILILVIPLVVYSSTWPGWIGLGLLILAGIAGGLGQMAMVQGYRHLEVAKGASIQMALPITASIGGYILFGEVFTAIQIAGATLTVFGTWRVVAGKTRQVKI